MSSAFGTFGGGSGDLSSGTATIYAASLGATNLDPSLPVRTTANRQLTTGLLTSADIGGLDADLSKIENIVAATQVPDVTTFTGVVKAADPIAPEDLATRSWVLANAAGAPAGLSTQTLRYDAGNLPVANSVLTNDGVTVGVGGAPTDANASFQIVSTKPIALPVSGALPTPNAGYLAYDTLIDKITFGKDTAAAPVSYSQPTAFQGNVAGDIAQEITSWPVTGAISNLQIYMSTGDGSTVTVGLSGNPTGYTGGYTVVPVSPGVAGLYNIPVTDTVVAGTLVYILVRPNTGVNAAVWSSDTIFGTSVIPGQQLWINGIARPLGDMTYEMTITPAPAQWEPVIGASEFATHTGDATIHFTQASIDHTAIANVGVNTHAQIDTHLAATEEHWSAVGSYGAPTVTSDITLTAGATSGDIVLSTPGVGAVVVDSQIQGLIDGAAADDACTFGQFDAHASDGLVHLDITDVNKLEAINVVANLDLPQLVATKADGSVISVAASVTAGRVYTATAGTSTIREYTMGSLGASFDPQSLTLTSQYAQPSSTGKSLTMHPSGSHVYLSATGILGGGFAYDTAAPLTGGPVYTIPSADDPNHIAFNWNASKAAVADDSGNDVYTFNLASPISWTLDQTYASAVVKNAVLWGLTAGVNREYVYIGKANGDIDVVDMSAAPVLLQTADPVGGSAIAVLKLSMTSDGLTLYASCGAAGVAQFTVNQTTGFLEPAVNPPNYDPGTSTDAVQSCGNATDPVLTTDAAAGNLITLDPATMTLINIIPLGGNTQDIEVVPDCSTVYVAGSASGLFIINTLTTIQAPRLEATSSLVVDGAVADIIGYNAHVVDADRHWSAVGSYAAPLGQNLTLTPAENQHLVLSTTGTGEIKANASKLTGLLDPTTGDGAATKAYVDSVGGGTLNIDLTKVKNPVQYAGAVADVGGWSRAGSGVGKTFTSPSNAWVDQLQDGALPLDGERCLVRTLHHFISWYLDDGSDPPTKWAAFPLDGQWFTMISNSDAGMYLFTFQVDGSSTLPITPPAYDTLINIPLATNDSAATIAAAMVVAMDSRPEFSAIVGTPTSVANVTQLLNSFAPLVPADYEASTVFANWQTGLAPPFTPQNTSGSGIYTFTRGVDGVSPSVMTRATDADGNPSGEIQLSNIVYTSKGLTTAGTTFVLTSTVAGPNLVADVDPQDWKTMSTNISGLADLTDTTIAVPANQDRIQFDTVTGKWVNRVPEWAVLSDIKPQGTGGGTGLAGYNQRVLAGQYSSSIPGLSLNNNQITLPNGYYRVSIDATVGPDDFFGGRVGLWDVSAGLWEQDLVSVNVYQPGGAAIGTSTVTINGILLVSNGPRAYEIRHWVKTANTVNFGYEVNEPGQSEKYLRVFLERL